MSSFTGGRSHWQVTSDIWLPDGFLISMYRYINRLAVRYVICIGFLQAIRYRGSPKSKKQIILWVQSHYCGEFVRFQLSLYGQVCRDAGTPAADWWKQCKNSLLSDTNLFLPTLVLAVSWRKLFNAQNCHQVFVTSQNSWRAVWGLFQPLTAAYLNIKRSLYYVFIKRRISSVSWNRYIVIRNYLCSMFHLNSSRYIWAWI